MTTISPAAPKSLVDFQVSYGRYLRQPSMVKRPKNIPARASKIYEELFFNNICGFINNCFPVAKSLFTNDEWLTLSRSFFCDWRCHTPYFSEIPKEFVHYIQQGQHHLSHYLWLCELVEYEWLELEVDTSNAVPLARHLLHNTATSNKATNNTATNNKATTPEKTNTNTQLYANPTLRNRSFEWPVHRICPEFIPVTPEATFLAVYRDTNHRVQFMAMNAITYALLEIIISKPCTAQNALGQLAQAINHPEPAQILTFGLPIITDFLQRGMLVSTQ